MQTEDTVEVVNTKDIAVDLHDGRTLAPGGKGRTTAARAAELGLEPEAKTKSARAGNKEG